MTQFDYKVVPAPRRVKKVKGVRGTPDLFALTLAEALNEQARGGWEYLRAEQLLAEERRGWFRGSAESYQTVLIFRRVRDSVGPRLAAARDEAKEAEAPLDLPAEAASAERVQRGPMRRGGPAPRDARPEPRLEPRSESRTEPLDETAAMPLRPVPKLGPAEKS